MTTNCPVCGRQFSPLEQVLAERDSNFQCHHCWTCVHAAGPQPKPRAPRRAAKQPAYRGRRAA